MSTSWVQDLLCKWAPAPCGGSHCNLGVTLVINACPGCVGVTVLPFEGHLSFFLSQFALTCYLKMTLFPLWLFFFCPVAKSMWLWKGQQLLKCLWFVMKYKAHFQDSFPPSACPFLLSLPPRIDFRSPICVSSKWLFFTGVNIALKCETPLPHFKEARPVGNPVCSPFPHTSW